MTSKTQVRVTTRIGKSIEKKILIGKEYSKEEWEKKEKGEWEA